MKAQAVASLKAEHPLAVLLEVAGIARSTFFYHQAKLGQADPRAELKTAIRDAFEQAHGRYGHRRILDNAVAENFFGHLKEELFHHDRFDSVQQLIAAIDGYIRWHNTERISTKLKGLSPVQYRTQALAA